MKQKPIFLLLCGALLISGCNTTDQAETQSARYENSDGWTRVYLASFPRSGNNWTQQLFEEATNTCCGSTLIYPHDTRQPTPYPWGGFCNRGGRTGTHKMPRLSDPVLIQSHHPFIYTPSPFDGQEYSRAVVLIRNPVDCLASNYELVRKRDDPETTIVSYKNWKRALSHNLLQWKNHIEFWEQQHDVLIVRYEDLLRDTKNQLSRIVSHVGYNVSDEDLQRAVNRYPPFGTPFKRHVHYDSADLKRMMEQTEPVLKRYGYWEFFESALTRSSSQLTG